MPEVLPQTQRADELTRFVPGNAAEGSISPKKIRTRADRMLREAERFALQSGLPAAFADPGVYISYVILTGRDPLEGRINAVDGEESPFTKLLRKVEVRLEAGGEKGESIPILTKKEREIYEELESRLKERGWVPLKTRLALAKILMPYQHHQLARIEVSGSEGGPIRWQEAASKMAMSGPGVRAMMEQLARRTASSMSVHGDSHIIAGPNPGDPSPGAQ